MEVYSFAFSVFVCLTTYYNEINSFSRLRRPRDRWP